LEEKGLDKIEIQKQMEAYERDLEEKRRMEQEVSNSL
jgi:hypothetical protein